MRKIGLLALGLAAVAGPAVVTPGVASAAEPAGQACVQNLDTSASACAATEAQALAKMNQNARAAAFAVVRLNDRQTGSSITYYGGHRCSTPVSPVEFQNANLGNWSNRADSLTTYNNCAVKLFDDTSFRGGNTRWFVGSWSLNGWSNRSSSLKVS